MFPHIPREYTQFASLILATIGMALMTSEDPLYGVMCIGLSCWILMISESAMLAKIQVEMTSSLECLRNKQEKETENLLSYLRDSQLGENPWSSIDAAKKYISNIGLPAVITDSGGACIAINKHLTAALGYDKNTI